MEVPPDPEVSWIWVEHGRIGGILVLQTTVAQITFDQGRKSRTCVGELQCMWSGEAILPFAQIQRGRNLDVERKKVWVICAIEWKEVRREHQAARRRWQGGILVLGLLVSDLFCQQAYESILVNGVGFDRGRENYLLPHVTIIKVAC